MGKYSGIIIKVICLKTIKSQNGNKIVSNFGCIYVSAQQVPVKLEWVIGVFWEKNIFPPCVVTWLLNHNIPHPVKYHHPCNWFFFLLSCRFFGHWYLEQQQTNHQHSLTPHNRNKWSTSSKALYYSGNSPYRATQESHWWDNTPSVTEKSQQHTTMI